MKMNNIKFESVKEYFSALPKEIKIQMQSLREIIKETAPDAEELISYNMPAFKYYGILVYYAAHKEHIGFYPGNKAVNEVFKDKLIKYETSKGTIRFPYDGKIPKGLIKSIIKFRMKDNLLKKKVKDKK